MDEQDQLASMQPDYTTTRTFRRPISKEVYGLKGVLSDLVRPRPTDAVSAGAKYLDWQEPGSEPDVSQLFSLSSSGQNPRCGKPQVKNKAVYVALGVHS